MNFDDLDAKMRVYEQSLDQVLLPELYLVARLDGNRFTRLTKEVCHFDIKTPSLIQFNYSSADFAA